jgi:oligoribonuclease
MKYISIDLETTGLDARGCQILEFAAIIDDTNCQLSFEDSPKIHRILKEPHDGFRGCAFALAMNQRIFRMLCGQEELPEGCTIIDHHALSESFLTWAALFGLGGKMNVAGKNFAGFDKKFLDDNSKIWDQFLHHRCIDVGSMWVDWEVDEELPNLTLSLERATGDKPTELHSALGDCWDVIKCVRADVARKKTLASLERGLDQCRRGELQTNADFLDMFIEASEPSPEPAEPYLLPESYPDEKLLPPDRAYGESFGGMPPLTTDAPEPPDTGDYEPF